MEAAITEKDEALPNQAVVPTIKTVDTAVQATHQLPLQLLQHPAQAAQAAHYHHVRDTFCPDQDYKNIASLPPAGYKV